MGYSSKFYNWIFKISKTIIVSNLEGNIENEELKIEDGYLPIEWQDNWKKYTPANEDTIDEDGLVTLYRGICEEHPGYNNAQIGIVIPWGINGGHTDPVKHNQQTYENDAKSVFTSWTTDEDFASKCAESGDNGKGLVLTKKFPLDRLVKSQDAYNENEVLVPGIITGVIIKHQTG